MSTPSGVKKRWFGGKRERAHKAASFNFRLPEQSQADHGDAVEKMDQETVACIVRRHEAPAPKTIGVKRGEHVRSQYVVSLRDCFVPDQEIRDRVPVNDQIEYARTLAIQPLSVGSLSAGTALKATDPWAVRSQFTPEKSSASSLGLKLFKRSFLGFWHTVTRGFRRASTGIKQEEAVLEQGLEQALEETRPRFSFVKTAIGFMALVFLVTLPAQALVIYKAINGERDTIEKHGKEAVSALLSAADGKDISASADRLQMASGKFREADRLLDESRLLAVGAAAVMPAQYRSARALLEIGDKMSEAGSLLVTGFDKIFSDPSRGLIERVEVLGAYARGALPLLTDAEKAAATVDMAAIPQAQREQAERLPKSIAQAKDAMRDVAVLSDALIGFLGKDGMRTYLLVFQNNTELRPSGGFMGSVAEVRIDRGAIQNIYIPKGGTYDLKGQLTERVLAPRPLHLINPQWQFQDANWFADFPKTAEKIRWFWSKSGQPTLDGVIAVNASFMEKVLAVTGPIELPEYGKTITAENFVIETQKAVELEYDRQENAPKKIIGDLFDKLMERIKGMERDQWLALAASASQAMDTKDIQIAMFDQDEEALVERFGWNGRIKETAGDSLAIIGANIAGQKTDAVVKEDVSHTAEIMADGSIVDTLVIKRTHNGQKGELFRGVRNVQYLRVYVPKGSELLLAKGFEPPPGYLFKKAEEGDKVDSDLQEVELTAKHATNTVWTAEEGTRTVFGGWLQLDPGQAQEVSLSYRLPFTARQILQSANETSDVGSQETGRGAYLMLLTSQSGKARELKHEVKANAPWDVVWSRERATAATDSDAVGTVGWQGVWDRDLAVAALLGINDPSDETLR